MKIKWIIKESHQNYNLLNNSRQRISQKVKNLERVMSNYIANNNFHPSFRIEDMKT